MIKESFGFFQKISFFQKFLQDFFQKKEKKYSLEVKKGKNQKIGANNSKINYRIWGKE